MKNEHIRSTEDLDRIADLLGALKDAKRLVRIWLWHGMRMSFVPRIPRTSCQEPETEQMLWDIYNKNSPEMKRINALISETEASLSNLIPA